MFKQIRRYVGYLLLCIVIGEGLISYSTRLINLVNSITSVKDKHKIIKVAEKLNKQAADQYHIVQSGDTLSKIAEKYYGEAKLWPLIYSANKDKIKDPNQIEPGWKLEIPERNESQKNKDTKDNNTREQYNESVKQQAKELGLVSLKGVARVKNYPYVVPELRDLALEIQQFPGVEKLRVTEAWPPTSPHRDKNHSNGRAMDFTIHDWPNQPTREDLQVAAQITEYIKSKGFDVVNEYVRDSKYKTGVHIHVDMGSRSSISDRVATSKKPKK